MTEAALASKESLMQYISKQHLLELIGEQMEDIELLWQKDKSSLRALIQCFEDVHITGGARTEELKSAFIAGLSTEAKKWTMNDSTDGVTIADQATNNLRGSSEASLETPVKPNNGHVASSPTGSDTNGASSITTPPTSETSDSSEPFSFINDRQYPHHLEHIPYFIKFRVAKLIWHNDLPETAIALPDFEGLAHLSAEAALEAISVSASPEMSRIAHDFCTPFNSEICKGLDREKALLDAGSTYLHAEDDRFIGGKINFSGYASYDQDGHIKVCLLPVTVKEPCRFTRRFGSERFFRLDIPKPSKTQTKTVVDFLQHPIDIFDRRFKFLHIKLRKKKFWAVTYFEYGRDVPSLWDFLDWHGPWEDNAQGSLIKVVQRMQLGLSLSYPGVYIPTEDVRCLDDIVSPTGEIMTDGAGLISRGAMVKIAKALGLDCIPSAVQGRFDGAKGMWIVDGESNDDEIWIGITQSQRKLLRQKTTDVAHQYLDVLNVSEVSTPMYLNKQSTIILAHNGVGCKPIADLLEVPLQKTMSEVMGQGGQRKDGFESATDIDDANKIIATEAKEEDTPSAKSSISDSALDAAEESVKDKASTQCKAALDTLFNLLLAESEAQESSRLKVYFIQSVMMILNRFMYEFRVAVPRSAELFVVPDRSGLLKQGEVQVLFGSSGPIDSSTKEQMTSLSGEVVVLRSPALKPSDAQKVKAVAYPDLSHHTKVLLVSTQGDIPLLKQLSNGDYDGDKVTVIWEPAFVEPFCNVVDKETCISIADVFYKDTRTIGDFVEKVSNDDKEKALFDLIMKSMEKSHAKGSYGQLHQVAQYMKGCDSQEAIDLAFKFNNAMDGVKSGLTIRAEVWQEDTKQFDLKLPRWSVKRGKDYAGPDDPKAAKRDESLGEFSLDVLYDMSNDLLEKCKVTLKKEQQQQLTETHMDEDLAKRWREFALTKAGTLSQQEAISNHCKAVLEMHEQARRHYGAHREETTLESISMSKEAPTDTASSKKLEIDRPEVPTFSQIRHCFKAWFHDHDKALLMAGREGEDSSMELSEILSAGELDDLNHLVVSCLYVQACEKIEDGVLRKTMYYDKVAFDIGAYAMFELKTKEKAKRLGLNVCL